VEEVEEFLKGVRHDDEPERVLATVLFLHGDSDLTRLRPQIERELQWYRGQSLTEGGGTEGPLASFDGPRERLSALVRSMRLQRGCR
jgi:hypothetical protein